MSYNSPEIRQFRGRYVQRNSFEVPDGALEVASNVTVQNDFIITKRRGFYQYYAPGSGTLKKLKKYENRLIAVYATQIAHYADSGVSPNLVGTQTVNSNEPGLSWTIATNTTPRSVEASENLYVTTDSGIVKLTAYNSLVQGVGAPPGQDLEAHFYPGQQATFFAGDKVLGYRACFGRTDANGNLILGAPGDVAVLTNPIIESSGGYSSSGGGTGPWTVTVTNVGHGLLTGQWITVSGASHVPADGTFQITVTGVDTFTYIVTSSNPNSGPDLDYYRAEAVLLEISVPEECADVSQGWFVQIYRSSQYDIAGDIYGDYQLITQRTLTAAEITANVLYFKDTVVDALRGVGLYTNENSGEGELQANARPPKATDIALFKNYTFYSNCQTRPVVEIAVVDPSKMTASDLFYLRTTEGVTTTEEIYVAREGVANILTYSQTLTVSGSGPYTVTVTSNSHGFSNGDVVYVSNILGGTFANQQATVSSVATNTFEVSLTGTGTPTSLWFEGLTNGTNPIFKLDKTNASFSLQLANTAKGLTKAISRRSSGKCYGRYLSDFSEVPGQIGILGRGFYDAIALKTNVANFGTGFEPVIPTSYGSVTSEVVLAPHKLYVSKLSEPEAVPLLQFLSVGSENAAILRIAALRDSVIIIKEDGVFRLSGDDPNNFVVTILDSTVICGWPDSVAVINNQVAMLSNVGVVLISESAVAIISRKIEEDIRPILGRASTLAHGAAYESERIYLLTATKPNDPALSVCHVYNTLTDEWTTWDKLFIAGEVGPEDTFYEITTDNRILRERKSQTKIDYSDQSYTATIAAVIGNSITIVITGSGVPEDGDMFAATTNLNRIVGSPTFVTTNTYTCPLEIGTNWIAGDVLTLYKKIDSTIITAPFHAGQVGRMKQFAQMQLHFRANQCTRLRIYFYGDIFLGSGEINWTSLFKNQGFGYFPFGFDFFGQGYGIDLPVGTAPAPICRVYVPIQQQRGTYIQTVINHNIAGEAIYLQAQSWSVRGYGERVSR